MGLLKKMFIIGLMILMLVITVKFALAETNYDLYKEDGKVKYIDNDGIEFEITVKQGGNITEDWQLGEEEDSFWFEEIDFSKGSDFEFELETTGNLYYNGDYSVKFLADSYWSDFDIGNIVKVKRWKVIDFSDMVRKNPNGTFNSGSGVNKFVFECENCQDLDPTITETFTSDLGGTYNQTQYVSGDNAITLDSDALLIVKGSWEETDVLQNGDFEGDYTGWVCAAGTCSIESTNPKKGNYNVRLTSTGDSTLYMREQVQAGTHEYSGWYRVSNPATTARAYIFTTLLGTTSNTEWTYFRGTHTDTIARNFDIKAYSMGAGDYVEYDDIQVRKITHNYTSMDSQIFIDNSSYGNTLTSTTPNFESACYYDGCYDFDGVDDEIVLSSDLEHGNITYCAWYKTTMTATGGIVGSGNPSNSLPLPGLVITGNVVRFYIDYDGAYEFLGDTGATNDDSWHLACGTSSSEEGAKLYVDGALKANNSRYFTHNATTKGTGGTIGSVRTQSIFSFDGTIDCLQVWNTSLSAQNITDLNNSISCNLTMESDNLVSTWDMNNYTKIVNDSSGSNHGDIGAFYNSSGYYGGAIQFDGVDDGIIIDVTGNELSVNETTNMAWVYTYDDSNVGTVIMKGSSDWWNRLYAQRLRCQFYGLSDELVIVGAELVKENEWHHVACNYNGTHINAYVDGVLRQSDVSTGTVDTSTIDLGIGQDYDGGGNEFDGLIDDAMIFNRSLSIEEVLNIYNGSKANYNYTPIYYDKGDYTSKGLDLSGYGNLTNITVNGVWDDVVTKVTFEARTSADNNTWSDWFTNGNLTVGVQFTVNDSLPKDYYAQYRLTLEGRNSTSDVTPTITSVTFDYEDLTPPTFYNITNMTIESGVEWIRIEWAEETDSTFASITEENKMLVCAGDCGFESGNSSFTESDTDNLYVNVIGDTMTGKLIINNALDVLLGTKLLSWLNVSGVTNLLNHTNINSLMVLNDANVTTDLDVGGNFTGNQIYAEMWFHNDTGNGETTEITTQGNWYNITGFNSTGKNGQKLNGFTYNNNSESLTALVEGLYEVQFDISAGNSGNNQEMQFMIFVNEEEQENTDAHRKIGASGDVGNAGESGLIRLLVGDEITLRTKNIDGTANLETHSAGVSLIRIGS